MTAAVSDGELVKLQALQDRLYREEEKAEQWVAQETLRRWAEKEARSREASAVRPVVGSLGRSFATLLAEVQAEVEWIIPTFLAPGWITKLAAREKVGKGVLSASLLGCAERGDPTPFGPSLVATALVYTEEPVESVREKAVDAGLTDSTVVYGWELGGLPWATKVDALVDEARHRGHGVLFIDNLAQATGVSGQEENDNTLGGYVGMLSERAKASGLAVLLNYHHRKTSGAIEDMSRGGTALAAACDINVEMTRKNLTTRVRTLTSVGRTKATCWQRAFELQDDHRTYVPVSLPSADSATKMSAKTQKRVDDRSRLKGMGSATAVQFAQGQGFTDRTGARRLDKLVDEGSATAEGTGAGRVWTFTSIVS